MKARLKSRSKELNERHWEKEKVEGNGVGWVHVPVCVCVVRKYAATRKVSCDIMLQNANPLK